MNRIILIGNGFDLAHGLKTSYADFINWYWTKRVKGFRGLHSIISNDGLCDLRFKDKNNSWNAWAFNNNLFLSNNIDGKAIIDAIKNETRYYSVSFAPLFYEICQNVETKKWVDIEEIFYRHLTQENKNRTPKEVNKELDIIKSNLIEYLNEIQQEITDNIIIPDLQWKILEPFSKEDIAIGSMNLWKEMMKYRLNYKDEEWERLFAGYNPKGTKPYSVSTIERFKQEYKEAILSNNFNIINEKICPAFQLPDNIMLLNFNYTDTIEMYLPPANNFSINYIHGSLSNPKHVIFGYGDEHDDEYQPLMKKNDNEYLRHIKSFRYLEAANYRKMLSFIEMDAYQVCIMGHSCGVSDRTLLKTLFEHKNCVSIKPYYHQKDAETDDYWDIVCNIARNISDPSLMRDRVVIKEHCESLGR